MSGSASFESVVGSSSSRLLVFVLPFSKGYIFYDCLSSSGLLIECPICRKVV